MSVPAPSPPPRPGRPNDAPRPPAPPPKRAPAPPAQIISLPRKAYRNRRAIARVLFCWPVLAYRRGKALVHAEDLRVHRRAMRAWRRSTERLRKSIRRVRDKEAAAAAREGEQRRPKKSILEVYRERMAAEEALQAMADGDKGKEERRFDYSSLSEHLVNLSLTRAIKRREWWQATRIALGWLTNFGFFTFMMLVYISYACVFGTVDNDSDSFVLSWVMSLAQVPPSQISPRPAHLSPQVRPDLAQTSAYVPRARVRRVASRSASSRWSRSSSSWAR